MSSYWRYNIDIKQFFGNDDVDDDDLLEDKIRYNIAEEMKKVGPLDELRNILIDKHRITTVRDFNTWLDKVYDFCDYHRIWLGL